MPEPSPSVPGKSPCSCPRAAARFSISTADGQAILKEQGEAVITPIRIAHETNAFSVRQNFKLTPDEGIYGLGQHQDGYMNYRGRTVKLVQANTQAVTPFLISTAG